MKKLSVIALVVSIIISAKINVNIYYLLITIAHVALIYWLTANIKNTVLRAIFFLALLGTTGLNAKATMAAATSIHDSVTTTKLVRASTEEPEGNTDIYQDVYKKAFIATYATLQPEEQKENQTKYSKMEKAQYSVFTLAVIAGLISLVWALMKWTSQIIKEKGKQSDKE